jgi:hypothetical protein
MTNKNESAFPIQSVYIEDQDTNSRGMTLRDYFAAKAMQAYLSSTGGATAPNDMVAREAYKTADEMMKAREK